MRNTGPRAVLAIAAVTCIAALPSFLDHVRYFLSGSVSEVLIRGNWPLVLLNIVLFTGFIYFLQFRRSIDWTSASGYGVYSAFIVSLFVEMYGIPLTIFLGSGVVSAPQAPPSFLFSFSAFGTTIGITLWYLVGLAVTGIGVLLVAGGWWQVYRGDGLVTDGLYRYSRNPQYLGIILIALGWVLGWPTLLTLTLFPFVLYAYYRLSLQESEDMREQHSEEYAAYAERVPLLI